MQNHFKNFLWNLIFFLFTTQNDEYYKRQELSFYKMQGNFAWWDMIGGRIVLLQQGALMALLKVSHDS